MQELQKIDRAQYDRLVAATRTQQAAYTREFAQYDEETIAAVDTFRKDHKMDYQGDTPGLVDARFIEALKGAYLDKRKKDQKH